MRAMRFAAGVQTSQGLGAGGPVRPATINPPANEPVYVTSVTNYIESFLRKNAFFRGTIAFLVLLVAVSVSCLIRSSTETIRLSNVALRDFQLGADGFASVRTVDEFYAHTEGVLRRAYQSRSRSANALNGGQRAVAVAAFVIRQFRTKTTSGGTAPSVLNPQYLPAGGEYNASAPYGTEAVFWFSYPAGHNLIDEPIADRAGSGRVFLPNAMRLKEDLFHGTRLDVSGRIYPPGGPQYQLGPYTYAAMTEDEAVADLHAARDSGEWVNFQTKALMVDTLWLTPIPGYFFYGVNILEVLGSGAIVATSRSYPFQPFGITNPSHPSFPKAVVALLADVGILLSLISYIWNMVTRARLEVALSPPGTRRAVRVLRFWMLYDMAIVGLVVPTLTFHAMLFALAAQTLNRDPAIPANQQAAASMTHLVDMSGHAQLGDILKGWLFIAVWLRWFGFLQFIPRLSIVTETSRAAANDLVGLLLIFFLFLAAFALAGTMLFSENVVPFATTQKSFDFLAQIVGTGEVNLDDDFRNQSPLASMYFIIYTFIVIALLLNAVIGVLASSFVYAAESYNLVRMSDWRPTAVLRSVVAFREHMRSGKGARLRDEGLLRVKRALAVAHVAAQEYAQGRKADDGSSGKAEDMPDNIVITLRQLRRLADPALIDDALVAEIFRKAQEQRGTANGKLRYLRIFGRQQLREAEMARDIGAQTQLLAQVQRQLFGTIKDTADEDDEGGDDALLDLKGGVDALHHHSTDRDPASGESARRPMHAFRVTLQELANSEASIARRSMGDHDAILERAAKVAELREEASKALAVFTRTRTALAVDRALQSASGSLSPHHGK
jgi:hypothetical protein